MKIIYKQPDQPTEVHTFTLLHQLGITGCHYKLVRPSKDHRSITSRVHHHTSCELHLVTVGAQQYLVGDRVYIVRAGSLILIPPNTPHQHLSSEPNTVKYSISFAVVFPASSRLALHLCSAVICAPLCQQAQAAISAIEAESCRRREYASAVIECNIFELLLAVARASGFREEILQETPEEDSRVSIARQYVLDNIERPITCPELADYCHLSQKQLTRLFLTCTGKTPSAYIRSQKIHHIEQLLAESTISLKHISERMCFSSECHFSTYFSKYAGMTPSAYRKMSNPAHSG